MGSNVQYKPFCKVFHSSQSDEVLQSLCVYIYYCMLASIFFPSDVSISDFSENSLNHNSHFSKNRSFSQLPFVRDKF